jgi:microcystin-dependent protein
MPFNGSGTFNPLITFIPNTSASAEDQNSQDEDFAEGLSNCITRDGQGSATANISMGGFQIKNLQAGTENSDAVSVTQLAAAIGASAPPGSMLLYGGSTAPSGYLLCDGSSVSRTSYSNLFAAIGVAFGTGDGVTTFNLPDLRGRAPIGSGTGVGLTPRVLGTHGGEETHVLTIPELASHTHTDTGHIHTDAGHTHPPAVTTSFLVTNGAGAGLAGGAGVTYAEPTATNSGTANIQTGHAALQNTGSGTAHNNMQPWLAVNYIIKI